VSGFRFRYRLRGGPPTVQHAAVDLGASVNEGDLLAFDGGALRPATPGDRTFVGLVLRAVTRGSRHAEAAVVINEDAVYAVDDPYERVVGDLLSLEGSSGAQGVAARPGSELVVVAGSGADEETLLQISPHHHVVAAGGGDGDGGRPQPGIETAARDDVDAAIACNVVRLYREYLGRGPTTSRAFQHDNLVVVVLEDTLTAAQRKVGARGGGDAVSAVRTAFQDAMRPELVSLVEQLTGREVRTFLSGQELDPDIVCVLFVLDRSVGPQDS
jgi:uncharacterized protein YbcI